MQRDRRVGTDSLCERREDVSPDTLEPGGSSFTVIPGVLEEEAKGRERRTPGAPRARPAKTGPHPALLPARGRTKRARFPYACLRPMSGQDTLSILAQVFPDEPLEALERVLTASRGDIDRATNALLAHHDAQRPTKRSKLAGGLDSWLGKKATTNGASPCGWFKEGTTTGKGSGNGKKGGAPGAEKSVFELMGRAAALEGASGSAPVAPALPPLTLTRPEQVAKETGGHCTLVLDVLPKELAAQLFLRMLQESTGSGGGTGCECLGQERCEQETGIIVKLSLIFTFRGKEPMVFVRSTGREPPYDQLLRRSRRWDRVVV